MIKIFVTFIILVLTPVPSLADTIVLKTGKRIDCKTVWEEENLIKCEKSEDIFIGFRKGDVQEYILDKVDELPAEAETKSNLEKAEQLPIDTFNRKHKSQ